MTDLSKPVQTRSGRPARIVSDKAGGMFPVLAIIENTDGTEAIYRFTVAGGATGFPGEHPDDLVNVAVETEEFFNIYLDDQQIMGPKETFEQAVEDAAIETLDFTLKLTRRNGKPVSAEVLNVA